MQPLWDQINFLLEDRATATLYASGWLLVLVLVGDVCLQTFPWLSLRRNKAPLKPVAVDGKLLAFAPTRRVHDTHRLFAIGYNLLVAGLLAGLWVALGYRDSCFPLFDAVLLVPLVPLREPWVGAAVLACVVLAWSGFRFRPLWSASLAGCVLLDVGWMFYVAWVCMVVPFDRLAQGRYPSLGLVPWMQQAWENTWAQKPSAHGFLVLGSGLFLIGISAIGVSVRRPREKKKRLFSIAYVPGARKGRSRKRKRPVEVPVG